MQELITFIMKDWDWLNDFSIIKRIVILKIYLRDARGIYLNK